VLIYAVCIPRANMEVGVSRVTVSKVLLFNLSFYGMKQCLSRDFSKLWTLKMVATLRMEEGNFFRTFPKSLQSRSWIVVLLLFS